MTKIIAMAGMTLLGLFLAGCSSDSQPNTNFPEPGGGANTPLYKDGGLNALKNWPPAADTRMGDSNTPRVVEVKGADNVNTPEGGTINNDTWSPKCPNLETPAAWPHSNNKRDITINNNCSFPIWIALQSGVTILPSFCSASKAVCSNDADCTSVTQTCSGGVCSEDTNNCSKDADCATVTQVCVNNAYGDGFKVSSGASRVYELPNTWISGRLWARTNCKDCTANQAKGTRCCETGDTGGTLYARYENGKAIGGETPNTLIELTLKTTEDTYDVSHVDGYNLPLQMMPVKGTGDDQTKPNGYYWGCPGVTGDVNTVCPDATMVLDTDTYPFGSDFLHGIALKDEGGKTIACWNGCSYKTNWRSCKIDTTVLCRKDQDCPILSVCSRDDKACTTRDDCSQKPDAQDCVKKDQGCNPSPSPDSPEASDYCCPDATYCATLASNDKCAGKKRCPVTSISAFYTALAPSVYGLTMGTDDWSTFQARAKNGVGPDYHIEFCPKPVVY